MIIPKRSLKFMVEVKAGEEGVSVEMVRYISVNKNESLSSNAKFAKHDALRVEDQFLNCHALMHHVIEGIKKEMPESTAFCSKIILKKGRVFGYS